MAHRNILGTWGMELSPDSFDAALIAAMILSAARSASAASHGSDVTPQRLLDIVRNPETDSGAVPATLLPDIPAHWPEPEKLARAWNAMLDELQYNEYHPIRLELRDWREQGAEWVINQLFPEKGTCVNSLFLASPAATANRRWQLPLRVGLLPDTASQRLLLKLRDTMPYDWLVRYFEMRPGQENCDLLLLPHRLPEALALLLKLPYRLTASCALILGVTDPEASNAPALITAMQEQLGSAAVGLLSLPVDTRGYWFERFIREWSHNTPLDLALFSSVNLEQTIPRLIADPGFIGTTQISHIAVDLAGRLRSIQKPVRGLRVPERLIRHIDPEGTLSVSEDGRLPADQVDAMARKLEEHLGDDSFVYDAESGDARDFSGLSGAMEELALSPPEDTRFLQSQILEEGTSTIAQALVSNQRYIIKVRIDEPNPAWVATPETFPDRDLDFSQGAVKLTLVFIEPNLSPEPLTGFLELPPSGPSNTCSFPILVPKGVDTFHARIYVLHQNRVLQGVYLAGNIVAETERIASVPHIKMGMESLIGPDFAELEGRRRFDAALVVNHTVSGTAGATAMMDGTARWIGIDRLEKVIKRLQRKLNGIAKAPERYESLTSDDSLDLLRYFAYHGHMLYEGIISDFGLQHLAEAERIQVVSARAESFLPLEFIYDAELPDDDAELCSQAEQILSKIGSADTDNLITAGNPCAETNCPQHGENAARVICPFGFWSLRKVIERHAFDPNLVDQGAGSFQLRSNPSRERNSLAPLCGAVFAASDRVDAVEQGQRTRLEQALKLAIEGQVSVAADWNEWKQNVASIKPSLLVLLPHILLDDWDAESLEIGNKAQLRVGNIGDIHVRPEKNAPEPVVLLLGCETGTADIPFESFVSAFRRHQSALVVSSLAKVLGRHAVPVAEAFVQSLQSLEPLLPVPFGEVALAARRRLVAEGKLVAMGLVAYGDADWMITDTCDRQGNETGVNDQP